MNDQRTLRALLLALLDQPAGATTSDLAHALGEPEATTSTAAAALASRAWRPCGTAGWRPPGRAWAGPPGAAGGLGVAPAYEAPSARQRAALVANPGLLFNPLRYG